MTNGDTDDWNRWRGGADALLTSIHEGLDKLNDDNAVLRKEMHAEFKALKDENSRECKRLEVRAQEAETRLTVIETRAALIGLVSGSIASCFIAVAIAVLT